jgi:serine/threonine protein kinase
LRLNPNLPADLERILLKAMEKDRQMRYQSAAELCVDLKRLRREVDSGRSSAISFDTSSPSVPATHSPQPPRRPSRVRFIAIAAAAAVAIAVLAWLFRPALPPPRVTGFTQLTHDGWQKNSFGQTAPTVLTDGARLYVQETVHGRFIVAQVSASGGDTVPIATPFPNTALDNLSLDRIELVVGSFTGSETDQPSYASPTLGGAPRRLTDLPGKTPSGCPVEACWSPTRRNYPK